MYWFQPCALHTFPLNNLRKNLIVFNKSARHVFLAKITELVVTRKSHKSEPFPPLFYKILIKTKNKQIAIELCSLEKYYHRHHTRGMFRPFHALFSRALCPNAQSQSKSDCHIAENHLWGSIQHYFFSLMTSLAWTLEPWNDFEITWQISSWFTSIVFLRFMLRGQSASIWKKDPCAHKK